MDLTMTDTGQPAVPAIQKIIEARTKELGETTEQACIALAINVLRSIRADTKLASTKANIIIEDVSGQFFPSFQRDKGSKGKNISTRVLRAGGKDGPVVSSEKVMWKCGNYKRGEVLHTYKVTDKIASDEEFSYLLVAESPKIAKDHAKKFHENKVKRVRGLAKFALGVAMHKVHVKESVGGGVGEEARKIGMKEVDVNVKSNGFNSGDVSITVHDKLDYSALALKSGESAVQLAMQRALNSMTAYLNKKLDKKGIQDKIDIPFPDMNQGGAA